MCQDEPSWEVLFGMLRGMYKKHPVRIDIAGTVESISHITAELLYKCYGTFYNLSNMVLCVAGNVDVDTVLSVADKVLKSSPKKDREKIPRGAERSLRKLRGGVFTRSHAGFCTRLQGGC